MRKTSQRRARAEVLQVSCRQEGWLELVVHAFSRDGCAVVRDLLSAAAAAEYRVAMYEVQQAIRDDVGTDRLRRAGELGILRLMMKYDPRFVRLLEIPEVLEFVDATVSPTAIMHLQNGFILSSYPPGEYPDVFQNRFHQDFPRVLNGYLFSVNVLLCIDQFSEENGGTLVVPSSQQQTRPPDELLANNAVPVCCPAGSGIFFDSTLWHAAGANVSGADRVGINQQFTLSYLKQQIDYVRALGDEFVQSLVPRTQQLLGWYTRVPVSLDEYYQPPDKRLYRSGQG